MMHALLTKWLSDWNDWHDIDWQMKNDVPTTLNKEAWDNKTISRLESELQKVIFLLSVPWHDIDSCSLRMVTLNLALLKVYTRSFVGLNSCFYIIFIYFCLWIYGFSAVFLCSEVMIAIYKGKGDPMECGSYRGIKLLEHAPCGLGRGVE